MQWIIKKIGYFMYLILGTSATESMVAAGNIFVGQTESPLIIRPFLKDCTDSELLAIMAAGMATISGSVLGAYISFGVNVVYVVTASVMAAPCVLALCKLSLPEKQESKFRNFKSMQLQGSNHLNLIQAAMSGASDAVPLVAAIGATLIAFLSVIAAFDGLLGWLANNVQLNTEEPLSLQMLLSYVCWPVTFLLGVEIKDVRKVSGLVGLKVAANEFIAYEKLREFVSFRRLGCAREMGQIAII